MNVILEGLSSCDLLCAALAFQMAEGLFARKSVGLVGAVVSGSLAVLSTPKHLQTSTSACNQCSVFHLQEIASGSPWIINFTNYQA